MLNRCSRTKRMMVPGANAFGQLWAPKQNRLYVGRDVLAMPSGTPQKVDTWKKQVVEDVVAISKEAHAKYQAALSEKSQGEYSVKLSDGRNVTLRMLGQDLENGAHTIEIHVPGEDDPRRYTVSEDTRITFDANGEPQVLSGGAASAGGVLRAENKDEILINFSSNKVEAGENTTVINFAGPGGKFTSGLNTTYLGSYSGATFDQGAGTLTFAGVFDASTLNVGQGRGDFSGVFTASQLNGGALNDEFRGIFHSTAALGQDGNDRFSGLFMDNALADAGNGDDYITGRFLRSNIQAGDGDDTIGDFRLNGKQAQEFQFIGSTIDTGAGNNQVHAAILNSVVNLGEGQNQAYGVFQNSTLNNAAGNANITALLSNKTDYTTGTGETQINLATAVHNDITTGTGASTVNLGVAENQHYSEQIDGAARSLENLLWTYAHRDTFAFGEVLGNQVNMAQGDARLNVSTGQNSYSVHARNQEDPAGRIDPATGRPEMHRLVDVTENLNADLSQVRTAANVRQSADLMLKFQAEDNGHTLSRNAGRGHKAYSYNLGRA